MLQNALLGCKIFGIEIRSIKIWTNIMYVVCSGEYLNMILMIKINIYIIINSRGKIASFLVRFNLLETWLLVVACSYYSEVAEIAGWVGDKFER